jgi:hypothetical protein
MRVIDDAFNMHGGYVLDFSDRTFAEYFEDHFRIQIDDGKYAVNGTSKAKRLRTFIEIEEAYLVSRILRGLWTYKENLPSKPTYAWDEPREEKDVKTPLFDLLARIEGSDATPRTDALEQFKHDKTLEELIAIPPFIIMLACRKGVPAIAVRMI